jgi:Ca2+-binding RTX toxin-like protein
MATSAKKLRPSLALEALEDRLALSAAINSYGNLIITGTGQKETAVVSHQVIQSVGYYTVTENGVSHRFRASNVWGGMVVFYGTPGADYFRNDTSLHAVAGGGAGSDTLFGGSESDYLFGGGNSDHLYGRGGDDELRGGDDNDYLFGGSESDKLVGGNGIDHLDGGSGDDQLDGGFDGVHDYLIGGTGADTFWVEGYYNQHSGGTDDRDAPSWDDFNTSAGDKYYYPSYSI